MRTVNVAALPAFAEVLLNKETLSNTLLASEVGFCFGFSLVHFFTVKLHSPPYDRETFLSHTCLRATS